MLSSVPLYISFGANAKKMLTWQFDTAKRTTTNTHAHIRTNPLSYSLSLLNNVSVEYIHIWLSISLLWNYNQLGIIMRRGGKDEDEKTGMEGGHN